MSFRSLLIAAVVGSLAAACSFDPSGLRPDPNAPDAQRSLDAGGDASSPDGSSPDGSPADAAVAPDAGCLADVLEMDPENFDRCDIPNPPGPSIVLTEGLWFLDTDDGTLERFNSSGDPEQLVFAVISQADGPEILLVAVEELAIDDTVTLVGIGSRALAIVSYRDIDIDGVLSVAALYQYPGAGSNAGTTCAEGAGAPGSGQLFGPMTGGSGGGGGGYGGGGGAGAIVAGSVATLPTAGGAANGEPSLSPLRGGCPGGDGGERNSLLEGSLGGGGGGALQLVAADTLTIGGYVTAGGGGGRGAVTNSAGGGGGGSGGGILLEAKDIAIEGGVMAQGGGGGQGRRDVASDDGGNGRGSVAEAAPGGRNVDSPGGYGGDGAYLAVPAEDGAEGEIVGMIPSGGGGGGGGVGRIALRALSQPDIADAVISPAPQ